MPHPTQYMNSSHSDCEWLNVFLNHIIIIIIIIIIIPVVHCSKFSAALKAIWKNFCHRHLLCQALFSISTWPPSTWWCLFLYVTTIFFSMLHSTPNSLNKLVSETWTTNACDQNRAVWLVGCVWKFLQPETCSEQSCVLFGASFLLPGVIQQTVNYYSSFVKLRATEIANNPAKHE